MPVFTRLNEGWNAEPNAPGLRLKRVEETLLAHMAPNAFLYPAFAGVREITLRFAGCARYRITPVNDETWHRGGCRFSALAPSWGEFYEIAGDTRDGLDPAPWTAMDGTGTRHFHFYLRDEALEVKAADWSLEVGGK